MSPHNEARLTLTGALLGGILGLWHWGSLSAHGATGDAVLEIVALTVATGTLAIRYAMIQHEVA